MGVSQNIILGVADFEKPKFEKFLENLLKGSFKIESAGTRYKLVDDDLKDFSTMEESILESMGALKKDGNYKSIDNLRRMGHHIALMSTAKKNLPNIVSKYTQQDLATHLSRWARTNSLELKPLYVEESTVEFAILPRI